MQSIFWFLIWILLFGGWSTPSIAVDSVSAPPAIQEVVVAEPFTLGYGATATVAGGKLAITFDRIVEDSRCPVDVLCAWSGRAVVALKVVADEVQTVELGGFTDHEGVLRPQPAQSEPRSSVEVAGYTVELLAVTPYPGQSAQPPSAEAYAIELVVR